ncbi:hypothetical protein KY316_01435 [Candidatus Woesearchaeota archaeon]|nr:hypothetical protein [Candidatus Woesearchaeota archaeon]
MDLVAILIKTPFSIFTSGRPDRVYVVEHGVFPDIRPDEKISRTARLAAGLSAQELLEEFAHRYSGHYVEKSSPLKGHAWVEIKNKPNSIAYFEDYFKDTQPLY